MSVFISAILILSVFSGATWFFLGRYAKQQPYAKLIFLFALFVHVAAVFAVYYEEIYPFGKGDQVLYHPVAEMVAVDFRDGIFSVDRIWAHINTTSAAHWYPAIVGGLYAVTVSDELVGMALNAWIAAVSTLLVFFLAFEISKSSRGAFWAGVVASFYPAYVYFSSLLLKDALVILLALVGILFAVKIMQRFSLRYIVAFGIALALLFHFRFYIGVALLYAFSLSWPFMRGFDWKQKAQYGIFILLPLGLIPSFFGYGYYATGPIAQYTSIDHIVLYRESAYIFEDRIIIQIDEDQKQGGNEENTNGTQKALDLAPLEDKKERIGREVVVKEESGESTVVVKVGDNPVSFIGNYLISFSFVSLGPFPWHFTIPRHYFALFETIPWWILLFFIARGIVKQRRNWQVFLPMLLFAFGVLAMVALLIDNFGIYTRIRIPAFLILIAFLAIPLSHMSVDRFFKIIRRRKKQKISL